MELTPLVLAAVAAVGAAVGAGATAFASYYSAKNTTRGAIRNRAIEIAEYLYDRLRVVGGSDTPRTAAQAELLGALVIFYIRTIRFAEGKESSRPQLPPEMAKVLDETFELIEEKSSL